MSLVKVYESTGITHSITQSITQCVNEVYLNQPEALTWSTKLNDYHVDPTGAKLLVLN